MGCRILAGTIYARDRNVADQPLLNIGNAQAAINIEEEEQTLPDYQSVSGGNACSVKDISGVELALTLYDLKLQNLAMAVFGSYDVNAADTDFVEEDVKVFADGALIPLLHIPTVGTVVVVEGATTYTEGTDYEVLGAGIRVIAGSPLETAVNAGSGTPKFITVDTITYDYGNEDVVEGLVTSGKNFEIVIDGTNRVTGKKEVWRMWNVQFGPVTGLNIITREFGSFELAAEILKDETIVGVGLSQYVQIRAQP